MDKTSGPIDCACVIHGSAYSWTYVERLFNMLSRHVSVGIRLHVFTEHDRPVPAPMIKHELTDWNLSSNKQGWWYKMQMFNAQHHAGPLLYFDLDTVIVKNIDWIWQKPTSYFWAVQDFKYLWREHHYQINSSVMWWDTTKFDYVWQGLQRQSLKNVVRQNHGDQDYLSQAIIPDNRRLFDPDLIKSWRWQCLDGGYNFQKKVYQKPGTGTAWDTKTSVVVFHGQPKPHQINDAIILQNWF